MKFDPSADRVLCTRGVEDAWESLEATCNNNIGFTQIGNMPDWIQEHFCQVAKISVLMLPENECKTALQDTWRALASECTPANPTLLKGIPDMATPLNGMKNLMCRLMQNQTLEHQASQNLCDYVMKFDPSADRVLCTRGVKDAWK